MRPVQPPPVALAIAGSDSSGGAGIQADLKAFAALGVHGACAITALTAQNTIGIEAIAAVAPEFVGQQIDVVVKDLGVQATKTGMLASRPVLEVVIDRVRAHQLVPLVVDPVLRATSGAELVLPDAVDLLRDELLPLATVVTPNLSEAETLSGRLVRSIDAMREAARAIHALGPQFVIVKGGHLGPAEDAVDILFDGRAFLELRQPRVDTPHTHGTGCTFASAIAAGLALQMDVARAAAQAKELVTEAVRHGLALGHGRGPVDAMAWLRGRQTNA